MAEAVFLGVEGGATRTTGALMEQAGRVLAECAGGPTNLYAVGADRARDALGGILRELERQAGAQWSLLAGSALCMAGLRGPADRAAWQAIVAALALRGSVLLMHDAAAALAAGSDDGTGILILCGTGSLAYGRNAAGAERIAGGRGALLGDEGSGFDIGLRGLRAAARSVDGRGPRTCLEQLIPQRLGLGGLDDLVAWVSPFAKDRIAAVAPIIFEAAGGGDEVAGRIIRRAAEDLARSAEVIRAALWPPAYLPQAGRSASSGAGPGRVVLSGGVFRGQAGFRELVRSLVVRFAAGADCVLPAVSGAVGAARLARGLVGRCA